MQERALVSRETSRTILFRLGDHAVQLLDVHRVKTSARNPFPSRDLLAISAQSPAALAEGGRVQLALIGAQRRTIVDESQIKERTDIPAQVSKVRDAATEATETAEAAEDRVRRLTDHQPARFDREGAPDVDAIVRPECGINQFDAEGRA